MSVHILQGDVMEHLRTLADESVNCVITSPPYWGLRNYGTGRWDGGSAGCQHVGSERYYTEKSAAVSNGSAEAFSKPGPENAARLKAARWREGGECIHCGARWSDPQIGLERTLGEHIETIVAVFREIKRVLRKDGVVWLNYGDCYASSVNGRKAAEVKALGVDDRTFRDKPFSTVSGKMKPKDRMMLPARIAIALHDDGWFLRDEVVWAKPNPMPSSVKDRTTPAHEMVYMLSKSRRYWYDAKAIAEPTICDVMRGPALHGDLISTNGNSGLSRRPIEAMRNKRSVWTVATEAFAEAHFATFPQALIEPMILAGCPKQCCAKCGAPWERSVRRVDKGFDGSKYGERAVAASGGAISGGTAKSTLGSPNGKLTGQTETLGWCPTCKCEAGTVPGTVLDPFGGSGTTALVADKLGRNAILIELNPEYVAMAARRVYGSLLAPLALTQQAAE